MFNVCPKCGIYDVKKEIESSGYARCPHCDHKQAFKQLPLYVITGASGSGKTMACLELSSRTSDFVFIEADIFWGPHFDKPDEDYKGFRDHCLRVAKNINQSGHPAVLCGTATPDGYEDSPERRYFAHSHYLALVSDDRALEKRLIERPNWRNSSDRQFISGMLDFNNWIKINANKTNPPMTLLDNTDSTIQQTADQIIDWLRSKTWA